VVDARWFGVRHGPSAQGHIRVACGCGGVLRLASHPQSRSPEGLVEQHAACDDDDLKSHFKTGSWSQQATGE
jgi:hypothetical protein